MEKRNIQIDINTARKWYLSRDSFKQELALQAFTKKELEEPKLPSSWEEYNKIMPEYFFIKEFNKYDTFPLFKLLILRDVYRQGWEPDWNMRGEAKYCIMLNINTLEIRKYFDVGFIFSFPTKELAEQFLENFRKELEQLKELL